MAMVVQLHEGVAINKFKIDDKAILRIGRDPDSDIFIDNTVVSTEHAVIKTEDDPAADSGPESQFTQGCGSGDEPGTQMIVAARGGLEPSNSEAPIYL